MKRTKQGDAKLAVAYCRASKDEQKLSPEAQRAAIEGWASREGVAVVAWHVEHITSVTEIEDRPALVAALADLRLHGAGVLAVAKRDRIARDTMIASMIDRAVAKCGARVATADGVANGDTAADGFLRSILDAVAAYERQMIKARTSAALQAKRARGERAGNVPYGHTADADGRLAPDQGEQAVIAEVLRLRATGLSQRGIVHALGRAGIVGRTGRPLALIQVQNILAAAQEAAA